MKTNRRHKLNMNIIKQPNLKNLTFSRIKKNQFKCLDLCIKALNTVGVTLSRQLEIYKTQ